MMVETEQVDAVSQIQDRIDDLTTEGRQEMIDGGENLGNALWKNSLGVLSVYFFREFPSRMHSMATNEEALLWLGSAVLAGTCFVYGFKDMFEGVHHIQSHNGIMREIASHRATLSRNLESLFR